MNARKDIAAPAVRETADTRGENLIVITRDTMVRMEENTRKMAELVLQLGTAVNAMQRRLDEMEATRAAVTLSHRDVLRTQAQIRQRARDICAQYRLSDAESVKVIRAAIKKDVLRRHQVKDLHDIPAESLPAVIGYINGWTSIRLVMERRGSL